MTNKHKTINKGGFTLIELLVVIAIIGLLSSVVLASLNSARVKARDARRLVDLNQISTALHLLADNNNGAFPTGVAKCLGVSGGTTCWAGSVSGDDTLNSSLQTYLSVVPLDPSNSNRTSGDAYLYVGPDKNVAVNCTPNYINGPFLYWFRDDFSVSSQACEEVGGFRACCGSGISCTEGSFCAKKIE